MTMCKLDCGCTGVSENNMFFLSLTPLQVALSSKPRVQHPTGFHLIRTRIRVKTRNTSVYATDARVASGGADSSAQLCQFVWFFLWRLRLHHVYVCCRSISPFQRSDGAQRMEMTSLQSFCKQFRNVQTLQSEQMKILTIINNCITKWDVTANRVRNSIVGCWCEKHKKVGQRFLELFF